MKLRILHVVPTYLPATRYGGPIYSVHGLCRSLAARGHRVEVFTTNVDGPGVSDVPLGRPVELDGVQITYFAAGVGRRLYRAPNLRKALVARAGQFDVVHLHSVFLWPTLVAAIAARRANVPYVVSPRGMLVGELIAKKSRLLKRAWIALFERHTIFRAAVVHVTAEIEATEIKRLGVKYQRVAVIPNGMDMFETDTLPAKRIDTQPAILFLGRINWKKGLDRLISAMVFVPHAKLIIAGNDEEGYQPALEKLAGSCGVAERVEFVGPVHGRDKWALLQNADVFALTSYSENFGIAVLEAMASGLPVVITPEVGLAGAVEAAKCGVVVQGEAAAIGEALSELLADPGRRKQMGDAGRRLAQQHYTWSGVAEAMELMYSSILRPTLS